jgi:tetratricopeptide (TPR) repeat protein
LWCLAREITRALKQDRDISLPMPSKEGFEQDAEYLEAIFIPDLQTALGDNNLLLTFDEFDSLEEADVKETLARPLIDKLGQLTGIEGLNFIFSIGSSGRKLENMQASYTEFFKAALYKEISFLKAEDTHRLITQPVSGLLHYEQAAIDRITAINSGHPYFRQLICHELFSHHQETGAREIREADVEAVLGDVVERGTVNLKFVWDEASDLEKWALAGLAQAEAPTDMPALAKILETQRVRFAAPNLEAALLHLLESDVLTQDNRFVVQLLRTWLRRNRPLERVRQELFELNPIASRHIESGLEYKSAQDHARALESFQEALRIDPENIQAQVNVGDALLDQSDWTGAIEAYQKALTLDDEAVAASTGLCGAHLALGNQALKADPPEGAARSYQQVLSINSEHTEARQRMADILTQHAELTAASGKFDQALSHFRKAIEYTPEDLTLEARYEHLLEEHRERVLSQLQEKVELSLRLGGGYPFFLQMVGYYLVERKHLGLDGDALRDQVLSWFDAEAASHYEYFWSHCSESEKITLLVILALSQQNGARRSPPSLENIAKLHAQAQLDIPNLLNSGLLHERDTEYRLLSPSLERWIAQEISASPQTEADAESVAEWLCAGGRERLHPVKGALPKFKKQYWPIVGNVLREMSFELAGAAAFEILVRSLI